MQLKLTNQLIGLLVVTIWQYRQEFISSGSNEEVTTAKCGLHGFADLANHFITDVMAKGVVDVVQNTRLRIRTIPNELSNGVSTSFGTQSNTEADVIYSFWIESTSIFVDTSSLSTSPIMSTLSFGATFCPRQSS